MDVTNSVESGAPSDGVPGSKKKREYPPRIPKGEFIRMWNSSKNVKDAIQKTGMSYAGAVHKAKALAANGVALKKLLICPPHCSSAKNGQWFTSKPGVAPMRCLDTSSTYSSSVRS